jgi:DNA-binding FadR family transcriptional regulator
MAKKPLTEKIAEEIIELIRDGKMRPGEKLENEYDLAEKLHVGRGSLREAIKILISRNILFVKQGSGTFVSMGHGIPTDPLGLAFAENKLKVAMDLMEIRLQLEPLMAAMAASYATPVESEKVYRAMELVEHLMDEGESFSEADAEFHKAVVEASGNQVMMSLIPILHTGTILSVDVGETEVVDQIRNYHQKIADAIAFGNTEDAKYAMYMHLILNRNYLMERYGYRPDMQQKKF